MEYSFNASVNPSKLKREIEESSIVTALDYITSTPSTVSIFFKAELSVQDQQTLQNLITTHENTPDVDGPLLVCIDTEKDANGAILSRTKVTETGWSFQLLGFEIQTATVDGVYSKSADGSSLPYFTYTMYDENGDVTLVEAECVCTVVDFEPPYDYEIVGGAFWQKNVPASDMYYSVMGVPDIPAQYGGSKVFVQGVDITYIGVNAELKADGRAPKRLLYSPTLHTNKVRVTVRHQAGVKHKFLQTIEHFKP